MDRQGWSVDYQRYVDISDPRLGRHLHHDSRSLRFLYPNRADDPTTLESIRHESHIPTLDQGQVGSCTGNASTKALSYDPFWQTAPVQMWLHSGDGVYDEQLALGVYSRATQIDPYAGVYLPEDTGSDGLSVAKVLLERELISGYQHATDLNTLLTALSKQPVIVGTDWWSDMFEPGSDGKLEVSGTLAGGHEYVLDELDVENQRVWIQNSWSDDWGIDGRAWMTWGDMGHLQDSGGDVTIFVPVSEPAPEPTPEPEVPAEPSTDDFMAWAEWWLSYKPHHGKNKKFAQQLQKFYDDRAQPAQS